jgi:hypothetical protein
VTRRKRSATVEGDAKPVSACGPTVQALWKASE